MAGSGLRLAARVLVGVLSLAAARAQPAAERRELDPAQPERVWVRVDCQLRITVADPKLYVNAYDRLLDQMSRRVDSGELPADEDVIVRAVIEELAAHPLTYLAPMKSSRAKTARLTLLGSATRGDAGWVVAPGASERVLRQQLIAQALNAVVQQDILDILGEIDAEVPQALAEKLEGGLLVWYLRHMTATRLSRSVFVLRNTAPPGPAAEMR